MEQRLSFITLGARNLEELKKFYTEVFGWQTLIDRDGVVFFKLNGVMLCLFPQEELAEDAQVSFEKTGKFKGFSMSVNYRSESEVDEVFEQLSKKGVKILKAAKKVFWGGYSGYISDPEDNLWEIAYNPFLGLDKDGNITGHQ